MSFELERKLIESAFKAGMPNGDPIQYSNTPLQPPAQGFTRITVKGGGGASLLGIGSITQRRSGGIVDVAIFVPRDAGTAGLRQKADQVEDCLAYQSFTEGNVRVVTFGAEFVDLGPMGDWHQGNVTLRYERETY